MQNFNITRKIFISFLIIALLAVVTIVIITQYLYQTFYIDHQINTLSSHGHVLASEYSTDEDLFFKKIEWSNQSLEWEVIFTDNPMIISGGLPSDIGVSDNLISFEERQTLLNGEDLVIIREHEKIEQNILAVVVPLMNQDDLSGAIFLYTPLSTIQESFRPLKIMVILSLIVLILIILLLATIIKFYIVSPIKRMTEVSNRFAAGDFDERLSVSQTDEIGQLANSFNYMASSLEKVEQNRREFLANVSHELRTPISYMKGFTEAFEEEIVEKDKYISIMKKETSRLGSLVHDLLDLAQLEGDSYPVKLTPLPFAQLILDVTERFQLQFEEKEIKLRLNLNDELIVSGDAIRLEQVITNLIQNAYKYSNKDDYIDIRLFKGEDAIILQVEDYGKGIPKSKLPRVTERFYRVNKARTRKDGGTGVGLAIVTQIIKKHSGDFFIESEFGKGTITTIKLPCYGE